MPDAGGLQSTRWSLQALTPQGLAVQYDLGSHTCDRDRGFYVHETWTGVLVGHYVHDTSGGARAPRRC